MNTLIETKFITIPLSKIKSRHHFFSVFSYIFIQQKDKNFCIKSSIFSIANIYIMLKIKKDKNIIGVWKVKKLKQEIL